MLLGNVLPAALPLAPSSPLALTRMPGKFRMLCYNRLRWVRLSSHCRRLAADGIRLARLHT